MNEQKVRYRGAVYTVYQSASGTWHAQGGGGFGSGATKGAALTAASKMSQETDEKMMEQTHYHSSQRDKLRSRQTECRACGVWVTSMPQHVKTKSHKNQVMWQEHQRQSRY